MCADKHHTNTKVDRLIQEIKNLTAVMALLTATTGAGGGLLIDALRERNADAPPVSK